MITAYIVPGFVINSFVAALIAAVVLGLVNAIINPILVLLTLPLTIVTLGLFLLLLMHHLAAGVLTPGFSIVVGFSFGRFNCSHPGCEGLTS